MNLSEGLHALQMNYTGLNSEGGLAVTPAPIAPG